MKETRWFYFFILVGGRWYLHEWGKLSNLKDIQIVWFHELIGVCSITIFSSSILFYGVNNNLKKFH
jgi:hypothetical protein